MSVPKGFAGVKDKVDSVWSRAKGWYTNLDDRRTTAIWVGVGITALCVVVGSPVLTYAFGGIVVNYLLWQVMGEFKLLRLGTVKYGGLVDLAFTVGSIVLGGITLGGWLTAMFASGYFTLFRRYWAAEWEKEATENAAETEKNADNTTLAADAAV